MSRVRADTIIDKNGTGAPNFPNGVSVSSGGVNITSGGANISGVSTLGTVRISSGIVTATTGIVTYYGDGSKLTGVAAAGSGGANDITSSLFF